MIHPNYSSQLLDILLKTKSDEKYTQANEADQQEALQLPIVTDVNKRTANLQNYTYDSTAFVSIDEQVAVYTKQNDAPVLETTETNSSNAKRKATDELNKIIENLKSKNTYEYGNFDSTNFPIVVSIHGIDASNLNRLKPAYAPVGSRVLNMTFNGKKPEEKEKEKETDPSGIYTVGFDWCYLGTKSEMEEYFYKQINQIKSDFEKASKAIKSYTASISEPYYSSIREDGYPIDKETLQIKINATYIYKTTATLYYGYTYRNGQSTSSVFYVQKTLDYYTLGSDDSMELSLESWLYSQVFGANDEGAYYPKKAFIGLFTEMPDAYGKNFVEPTWKTNDNLHTYQRISLHEDLLYGDMSLNNVRQIGADSEEYPNDATEHSAYLGYAFVDNKEIVLFPEILDESGWGEIVGFGLFENEEPTEGETPYFWGNITNKEGIITSVPTEKWKVPLFRKNEFKIYLG